MDGETIVFHGRYHNLRTVISQKVAQVVIEIPMEQMQEFVRLFGAPNPETWIALARIEPTQVNPIPVAVARLNPELPSPSSHQTSPGNFDATGGVSPPSPGTDGRKPGTQSKPWASMNPAQQAGILCNEKDFRQFISMHYGDAYKHLSPAEFVRELCGVKSRKDIASNHKSRVIWHQLVEDYRVWQRYPEMVP